MRLVLKKMQDLKNDFIECGHNEEKLDNLEPKAALHAAESSHFNNYANRSISTAMQCLLLVSFNYLIGLLNVIPIINIT